MSYNHAEKGSEKDAQGSGQPSTTGVEHEQLTLLVMDGAPLEPINGAKDIEVKVREDLRHKFWVDEGDRVKAIAQREKGVRIYTPATCQL